MKFYGPIGYAEMVETSPGVWDEKITEHMRKKSAERQKMLFFLNSKPLL